MDDNVANDLHLNLIDDGDDEAIAAVVRFFENNRIDEHPSDGEDENQIVGNDWVPQLVRQRVFVDVDGWRRMNGASFRENFRMDKCTFQKLFVLMGNHLVEKNRIKRLRTPFDLCLLMGIWILANGDTFRSTASHFGVSKSSVHYDYQYIIEALRELAPRFIKWPSAIERDTIKVRFEERYHYPGVVGCIDITAPLVQAQRYINRYDVYSILAQAVCDNKLLYRDIHVGQPGSVGDARTFRRSPLCNNLLLRPEMLSADEHLLGDGAYTLTDKVLIPYIDGPHATPAQRKHNKTLSSCRASIERSFALLFGRMRRMKLFQCYSLAYCIDHIVASFVIHNGIILEGEDCPGVAFDQLVEDPAPEIMELAAETGAQERHYICELLAQRHRE